MLNRALVDETIKQIPGFNRFMYSLSRGNLDCYRSIIPFIEASTLADIQFLMAMCTVPTEQLTELNNTRVRQPILTSIVGRCTDRTVAYEEAHVADIINHNVMPSGYGTQILLVNVTNRAQYPVILRYIREAGHPIVTQATTNHGGKPVEFIGIKREFTTGMGYDYDFVQYVFFTTLWNYDLNLSFVYTALNHMLTVPAVNESCTRTVVSRIAYTWFEKYFKGEDITPLVLEYFKTEYLDKLEEIQRTKILNALDGFKDTKITISDNIERTLRDLRNNIESYEREIANLYMRIREVTLSKLTEQDKMNLLDDAIKIFKGMLDKGTLLGFNYKVYSNRQLKRFSWRVVLPITYWEDDEAKYWLNTYQGNKYKHDLFKAMFIDKLITSWCDQYMTIDISEGGYPSNNCGEAESLEALYPNNPHVGRFNCFGNNASEVKRAINNKDVATAISICMNACMQLNMTDHTVTSYWMNQCDYHTSDYNNVAFLEYRGSMYTPAQLHDLYKSEGGFSDGKEIKVDQQAEEADA